MEQMLAWMETYPLLMAAFIIAARVVDVSLGTIRMICVVRGYRVSAAVLGFLEIVTWVVTVSGVLAQITPIKVLAYATGFALGNATGMWIEGKLAMGRQMIMFISRTKAHSVAFGLRMANYVVTQVSARGSRGKVAMCFVVVPRGRAAETIRLARQIDEKVFVIVEDVRDSTQIKGRGGLLSFSVRDILKRK